MPEGMEQAGAPPMPAPGGGAPAQPQGQASGPSPATMPTPNAGITASALSGAKVLVQAIQRFAMQLPVGSDVHNDFLKAVQLMSKHLQEPESPGVMNTSIQNLLMQQRQMAPQIAAMRAGQMGGGAAPQQPMPQ